MPSFNKTYSIVSRVETQRSVVLANTNLIEASSLATKMLDWQKCVIDPKSVLKKNDIKKAKRYCTYSTKMIIRKRHVLKNMVIRISSRKLKLKKSKNEQAFASYVTAQSSSSDLDSLKDTQPI